MNCNPCCGCLPPITTYDPSVANNFPTILQQVEYLKALLKKYPSQQWFITQEKVTEETKSLNKLSILSNGREPQGGDFILGNKENGTTLLFQYTGVITEYVNYNLIYVGVFTNQDLAQQALSLAQVNEQDITSAEARITSLEAEASIEVTITPASATSGTLTEEQYNKLITNDNCYIKLNEVVYTLSKNSATGVLIYSSKYLSDTKTVRTITVTKSSKAWVMTEVSVGGGKLYRHLLGITITVNTSTGQIATLEGPISAEFFSYDNSSCSNYNDVKARSKNNIFMQAFGLLAKADFSKLYSVVGFENNLIYYLEDNMIVYSTYKDFTCTDKVIEC